MVEIGPQAEPPQHEHEERHRDDGLENPSEEHMAAKKQETNAEHERGGQALGEASWRRSDERWNPSRARDECGVEPVERVPLGDEGAPQEQESEGEEKGRGLRENPDRDDHRDQPRLKHERRVPDGARGRIRVRKSLPSHELGYATHGSTRI